MKRTWPFLFALLVALPAAMQAQFTYTTNNGEITLTAYTGSGGVVVISNFVTSIGDGEDSAFGGTAVTSVTIPTSVINIGDDAFEGCTHLTSVYFEGIPPSADSSVFAGDGYLSVFYNPGTSGWGSTFAGYPVEDEFYLTTNADNTLAIAAYPPGPGGAVTVPNTIYGMPVASIGESAFYQDSGLTSVTIGTNVTTIGSTAFFKDSGLTSITIGTNVTTIGEEAFAYCSGLTSVTIPSSVTSIGDRAFKECTSVTNFSFDGKAPAIGDEVFESDFNAIVYYLPGATGWSSTFGGLQTMMLISPNSPGLLQVNISPVGAISAGAQWQVDGPPSESSGVIVTNLTAGAHGVSFASVPGWITPPNQTVTTSNGTFTSVTGVYTASVQAQGRWSERIASVTVLPDGEPAIGMTLDAQGNCYLTGLFDGTNDFGGVTLTNESVGGSDIFVAKYNSSGVLQWAQRAGDSSTNFNYGRGIGVDTNENVYVTGGFYGPVGIGGFNLPVTTDEEFFLAKYDSAGAVQWVQQSAGGNTGNVYGTGLAVDGVGNSYAVVYGGGSGAAITFGSNVISIPSGYDEGTVLVKYDNTGALRWAQLLGGSGETYATKVAVDAGANVYVCGSFEANMTIGNSNLVGSVVGADMFIAKFDNSGALVWVQQTEEGNGGSGGVAVDQTGNVFVAIPFEGTINLGGFALTDAANDAFVAKYNNSGTIQWARQAGATGFYEDVALDSEGNVYPAGYVSSDATVAKYDSNGTFQWTYSASGPSASPVSSLVAKCAVDSTGNCYLAGLYQGTVSFGANVLQPQGSWNFFLAEVAPPTPPPVITSQPTNQSAIVGNNVALGVGVSGLGPFSYYWRFNGTYLPEDIISTVAGDGTNAYSGDGGLATNASLNYPAGVVLDGFGNVFIADEYNNVIRRVDANGIISTVAGTGTNAFFGDGGPATNAGLNYPIGLAIDRSGNLYIADDDNNCIRKVSTNGIISTVAGTGSSGYSGDGGPAINASLSYPHGIALDSSNDLFIADWGNGCVRKVSVSGVITTVAGNGTNTYFGDGGAATNASLNNPSGVAVDASGDLIIADESNFRIRKVDTYGVITTVAGDGTPTFGGDGGPATNASLNYPFGVAVDGNGDIFIGDFYNHRIREVNPNGIIATVAGNGTATFAGDGGPATFASLNYPRGVAVDASGDLFIADWQNNRLREVPDVGGAPILSLDDVGTLNAGNYEVIVSGSSGNVASSVVTLTVTLSALSASIAAGTNVQFQFSGAPGSNYVLQYSTNLSPPVTWQTVVTNTADSNGNWAFTETNVFAFPSRFFRITAP